MGMPSFHPFSPTRLDCVRLRDEKFAVKVCAPSSHLARKVSIHPEWDWTVHPSSAATEIHLEPSHRDPGLTEYFVRKLQKQENSDGILFGVKAGKS